MAMARQASIRRHLEHGWAIDVSGLLSKGVGRSKVEARPTVLMPSKSGDVDFNPGRDAYALRLGAVFVGANRYRLPDGLLVDANGAMRDEHGECPECGSSPITYTAAGDIQSGGEYRFRVPTSGYNPKKPWEHEWTYCRRCVSDDELAEVRRRSEATPQPAPQRRQRYGAH